MHPAYDGLAALPYYDEFDLSTVDVLLISQYVTLISYGGLPPTLSLRVFEIVRAPNNSSGKGGCGIES